MPGPGTAPTFCIHETRSDTNAHSHRRRSSIRWRSGPTRQNREAPCPQSPPLATSSLASHRSPCRKGPVSRRDRHRDPQRPPSCRRRGTARADPEDRPNPPPRDTTKGQEFLRPWPPPAHGASHRGEQRATTRRGAPIGPLLAAWRGQDPCVFLLDSARSHAQRTAPGDPQKAWRDASDEGRRRSRWNGAPSPPRRPCIGSRPRGLITCGDLRHACAAVLSCDAKPRSP